MSAKCKFRDQSRIYFISFAVVYWIDVFIRNEYKEILLGSWRYCQKNKGLEIYAWCIMTSHVHLIIGTHGNNMGNIIRDMKRHTAEQLRSALFEALLRVSTHYVIKDGRYKVNDIEYIKSAPYYFQASKYLESRRMIHPKN